MRSDPLHAVEKDAAQMEKKCQFDTGNHFHIFCSKKKMPNSARSPMNTELGVRKVQLPRDVDLPSMERSHIPTWEKLGKSSTQKCRLVWGYVNFPEGTYIFVCMFKERDDVKTCLLCFFLHMSIAIIYEYGKSLIFVVLGSQITHWQGTNTVRINIHISGGHPKRWRGTVE